MPEPQKNIRRIHPSRCKLAEFARAEYVAIPEDGTTFDEVKDSAYWAHMAPQLRVGTHIEVLPEEGSYWALLIVRAVSNKAAQVGVILKTDFEPVKTEGTASQFVIKWRGPHHKHGVVRIRDDVVVEKGFDTPEMAAAWLASNVRTLAA